MSFSTRCALPEVRSGLRGVDQTSVAQKACQHYGCALCGTTVGVSSRVDETHRGSTLVFHCMDFGMILAKKEWQ